MSCFVAESPMPKPNNSTNASSFNNVPRIKHQRKKRKVSPNTNCRSKHTLDEKYERDLIETNKFLKKKLNSIEQSHSAKILQLKQFYIEQLKQLKHQNASKLTKMESKAIKLSANLKKFGFAFCTVSFLPTDEG